MMYLLAVLAVVAATLFMVVLTGGGMYQLIFFLDIPSIIILLVLTIPIIISAGLMRDFGYAFKLAYSKNETASIAQFKKCIEAVGLMIVTIMCSGGFTFVVSVVVVMTHLSTPQTIGPNLAVGMLSLVYAFVITLVLLPVKARLNVKMAESIHQ